MERFRNKKIRHFAYIEQFAKKLEKNVRFVDGKSATVWLLQEKVGVCADIFPVYVTHSLPFVVCSEYREK